MNNYNNPWEPKGPQNGNSFEKNVKDFWNKLFDPQKNNKGEQKNTSKITIIIILIVIVIFLIFDSVYQIQPGEQGVILRLGKFHQLSNPGLHVHLPIIDSLYKVDIGTIRKENFGGAGTNHSDDTLVALALTSDKNVIRLSWVVQYKVKEPINFLFAIRDPRAWVRDISQAVMRRVAGNKTFDEVLASREELSEQTREEMQALLDKYNAGIQVVTVQLQDAAPPGPVRPAFDEVNDAEQDRARLVNEAEKERNSKIPKAKGEAKKLIEEAKGYAIARVQEAKGDADLFDNLYKAYKVAKEVTKERLYVETMRAVLPKVKEVVVIDQGKKGTIPLLNIGSTINTKSHVAIAGEANEK